LALVGVVLPGLEQIGQLRPVDLPTLLHDHPAPLGLDALGRDAPDQVVVGLAGGPQAPGVGVDLELGHRHVNRLAGAAVLDADYHVLGDVD